MAEHVVIGTAGHVDHGKTALVEALTGVDCDRLPEEKARGITIELGFARWDVGEGLTASIVDVPGHERFVGTMVAGASGMDGVLLVVAADDGVMPQTREHLAICQLLGMSRGVVAITKCDAAAPDLVDLVVEDVRGATAGSFLAGAEIVRCSARTGAGLDALRAAAVRAFAPRSRAGGPAFLAIDRAFARPGAGTVVTGTLVRGTLRAGDDVEALPGLGSLRIRGMQVHGRPSDEVVAATRVAVSLGGGEGRDTRWRGSALVAPGSAAATTSVHAELSLLPGSAPLGRRAEAQVHLGTTAFTARVRLLDGDRLQPGERGLVLLGGVRPFVTFAGQRFVLRRAGRRGSATAGGGIVHDPAPVRARRHGRVLPGAPGRPVFFFEAADALERVRALVGSARHLGIDLAEVARRASAEDDPRARVAELARTGAVVLVDGRLFDASVVALASEALHAELRVLHRERPLLRGFSTAELVTRVAERHRRVASAALTALAASGELIALGDGLVRSAGHEDGDERERVLGRVSALFAGAGLAPPADDRAAALAGIPAPAFRDAIAELRRRGTLRVVGAMCFDASALAGLRATVARWFAAHPALTPGDLKELSGGLTRRHVIPLLEWLDQERVTVRRGDARVPGPALR